MCRIGLCRIGLCRIGLCRIGLCRVGLCRVVLGFSEGAQPFLCACVGDLDHDGANKPGESALDEKVVGGLIENGGSDKEKFEQEAFVEGGAGEGKNPPFTKRDGARGEIEVIAQLGSGCFVLGLLDQDLADAVGDTGGSALEGDLGEAFSCGKSELVSRKGAKQGSPDTKQEEDLDFLKFTGGSAIHALSADIDGVRIGRGTQDRVAMEELDIGGPSFVDVVGRVVGLEEDAVEVGVVGMFFFEGFELGDDGFVLLEKQLPVVFGDIEFDFVGGDALGFAVGFDALKIAACGEEDLSAQGETIRQDTPREFVGFVGVCKGLWVFGLGSKETRTQELTSSLHQAKRRSLRNVSKAVVGDSRV